MLKEACVGNFSDALKMIEAGGDRIELNSDLAQGGVTPSYGTIKRTIEYAHKFSVPVVVMVRPRGGNFIYSSAELAIMLTDLEKIGELGADGVAFGSLTSNNELDKAAMLKLIIKAKRYGMQAVMHMAFDEIPIVEQRETLAWLIENGVSRVLTHGGTLDKDILKNIEHLRQLVTWANKKITILPGGGISTVNREEIAKKVGVNELHGTKIVIN